MMTTHRFVLTTLLAAVLVGGLPASAKPATPKKDAAKAGAVVAAKDAPVERPVPRVINVAPDMPAAVRQQLQEGLNDPALDGADLSFLAVRMRDGQVLAESGADKLINPASNAKLITTAAALHTLKPEYRWKTEYYVAGVLKDGVLHGNLVVKGYGDPTVVSERLAGVANDLYLFGVEQITGGIVVDDSFFDGLEEPRGWEIEEAPDRAYAAPISALTFNYNAIALYVRPGEKGAPAVLKVDPPIEQVVLEGEVLTDQLGRGVRVYSQDDRSPEGDKRTLLTVEGSVGYRESPFRMYRRVYEPAKTFGSALVYFLQQRGVKVRHNVMNGTVPAGARLIIVDRSKVLAEVVRDLNHYSNNIIAETLIKTMGAEVAGAPGSMANGLAVARTFLEERVGLKPGTYTFDNGSGLNDVNRFTARQLVRVLQTVSNDFETGTEYTSSLAVAGTQGTIGFRMKETPAQRRLRAKTGTLRGVSALSGLVVDPSGDIVLFSMLAQGFKNGASSIWKIQNLVGTTFASDGAWRPEDKEQVTDGDAVSLAPGAPVEPALGGAP